MSERAPVPVQVIDESATRYVRWFALGCFVLGCSDLLWVVGRLLYLASQGWLFDLGAVLAQPADVVWLLEGTIGVWGLMLLIGGWGMLKRQEWSRMTVLVWAFGDMLLTVVSYGYWARAYAEPGVDWATRVNGWLELPSHFALSISIAVLAYLFLTRPSVIAVLKTRGFEVMPVDRQTAA